MGEERRGVPVVPALDGIRTYAILGVVLIHLLLASGVMTATEGTLVNTVLWALLGNVIDAFFIISGFVLFLPIVVRGGQLGGIGRFARGRAARLLPAYWFCVALTLALVAVVPTGVPLPVPSAVDVVVHLAILQMPTKLVDPDFAIGFGVNGPLWMISVIVGFYLVLPLIARAYFRHPLLGLVLAAAVTLGWKELALHTAVFEWLAADGTPRFFVTLFAIDQLPGWIFSFALGMTGACGYVWVLQRRSRTELARLALWALPAAAIVYVAFAIWYAETSQEVNGVAAGISARGHPFHALGGSAARAVLIGVVAIGPLWLQRPFTLRPIVKLAELSYSLYLIHVVVMIYAAWFLSLSQSGSVETFAIWVLAVLPPSLLYAYASSRWIEQPARNWARRREHRGGAASAGTETADSFQHPVGAPQHAVARSP